MHRLGRAEFKGNRGRGRQHYKTSFARNNALQTSLTLSIVTKFAPKLKYSIINVLKSRQSEGDPQSGVSLSWSEDAISDPPYHPRRSV